MCFDLAASLLDAVAPRVHARTEGALKVLAELLLLLIDLLLLRSLLRSLLLFSLPPPTHPSHHATPSGAHGRAFSSITANRAHGRSKRGASSRSSYRAPCPASCWGPLARWRRRRCTRWCTGIKAAHLHR